MSATTLTMTFAAVEAHHLLSLVDQFIALLDEDDLTPDPARERLAPSPYPDAPDDAAEYRASTRDDLLQGRRDDAGNVRRTLEPFERFGETAASAPVTVTLDLQDVDPWLRTLTALRLVLASRLGIEGADSHDPEDLRFGTYDWLGYRLEILLELADDAERRSERPST